MIETRDREHDRFSGPTLHAAGVVPALVRRVQAELGAAACRIARFALEGHLIGAFYTTKADGMGMGLSVSRSIIERHRGRMWAARHEGPGATFAFAIPAGSTAGADTKV